MGDDFERDIAVRKMPAVGVGHDLALGEFSHFLADRFERVVETVIQHQRTAAPHQLDEARAVLRIVAAGDPTLDSGRHPRRDLRAPQAEIGGPDDLALADRDAADGLREVFADTHADGQRFELAQSPGIAHALGVGCKLPHRLHIGREPGKAVGGALLAVQNPARHVPGRRHPRAHCQRSVGQQRLERRGRILGHFHRVGGGIAAGMGQGHRCLPRKRQRRRNEMGRRALQTTRALHKSKTISLDFGAGAAPKRRPLPIPRRLAIGGFLAAAEGVPWGSCATAIAL